MGIAIRQARESGRRVLSDCALFRGLSAQEQDALFAQVQVRSYAAGQSIFQVSSAGENMMAVLSGSVRISVPSAEGKEIVLAILQPGEVFGEIALIDGKERTADATAMTASQMAILERRDVFAFLDAHPRVWAKLAEVLCGRLRNTDQHIAEVALLQLPNRLAKALLRYSSAERRRPGDQPHSQIHLPQHELGNICGASREAVNKCLAAWQRRGIVNIEKGLVTVVDAGALAALA